MLRKCVLALALAIAAGPAAAYIGPGAGISFVGSLFTWLIGIFIALFAILFWPVRVLIRRMRRKPGAETAAEENPGSEAADADRDR